MLRITYGTETDKPAMDTWQTVFVFGEGCVERVDTPELLKPMELDRGQAWLDDDGKEAKRASNEARKCYNKSWRTANADYNKSWRAANANRVKAYNAARKDSSKEYYKAWIESNKDHKQAYHKAWLAVNKKRASTQQKAWKDANKYRYLCPNCKDWPAACEVPPWTTSSLPGGDNASFEARRCLRTECYVPPWGETGGR
jgi:hypothetical protein